MKRTTKILLSIFSLFFLCLTIHCSAEAHTVAIGGPNTVTVTTGTEKEFFFPIYIDGHDHNHISNYIYNPDNDFYWIKYRPDIEKKSKHLEITTDEDDDKYDGFTIKPTKSGTYSFVLKFTQVFEKTSPITVIKRVTVKAKKNKKICVEGELSDYSTRNNTFYTKITNYSYKPIKIYSTNAIAMHNDYKTFDRKVKIKGKNSVTVKPGKTIKIKFKHSGRHTWYDVEEFLLRCRCKFNGKKYTLRFYSPNTFEDETYDGSITVKKGWK